MKKIVPIFILLAIERALGDGSCASFCSTAPDVPNGVSITYVTKRPYFEGETVTYACPDGDFTDVTCGSCGIWNTPSRDCPEFNPNNHRHDSNNCALDEFFLTYSQYSFEGDPYNYYEGSYFYYYFNEVSFAHGTC